MLETFQHSRTLQNPRDVRELFQENAHLQILCPVQIGHDIHSRRLSRGVENGDDDTAVHGAKGHVVQGEENDNSLSGRTSGKERCIEGLIQRISHHVQQCGRKRDPRTLLPVEDAPSDGHHEGDRQECHGIGGVVKDALDHVPDEALLVSPAENVDAGMALRIREVDEERSLGMGMIQSCL